MKKIISIALLLISHLALADWQKTLDEARGQTVFFHAWAGSEAINSYISKQARIAEEFYGIKIKHVKITNTADSVNKLVAASGKSTIKGTDVMWINGENFALLKSQKLLVGELDTELPNSKFVDTKRPSNTSDFGIAVDGYEVPWGTAQLIFYHDSKRLAKPPLSVAEILEMAPDLQFSYPQIPDFHGVTFLKQALIELAKNPEELQKPVSEADFQKVTKPLWDYLDELHPKLWKQAKSFPASIEEIRNLVNNNELQLGLSFNPAFVSNAIKEGNLPESARSYIFSSGTLANSHFLGISNKSPSIAAAKLWVNHLISPEAQLAKADDSIWGDPTILDMSKLSPEMASKFAAQPRGIATLSPQELNPALAEPHASWADALKEEWLKRYRN